MNMMNKLIKLKAAVMNFDNDCEQICVKNEFMTDDKVYNE